MTMLTVLAGGWGHMWWGPGGPWMWLWGPLMMVVWLAIIVTVVWLITRAFTGTRRPRDEGEMTSSGRAREILAERYASGELTTEEYQERLKHLDNRRV